MTHDALPAFWSAAQFADMMGLSQGQVCHAAKNYVARADKGAALPAGFGALKWAGVWVVYALDDEALVRRMFAC